ncbi:hypothetical protein FCV25MIE_18477 [Fagus crenata]
MASVSSFYCPNPNPISPRKRRRLIFKKAFSSSRSLFLGSKLFRCRNHRSWNNRVDHRPAVADRVGAFRGSGGEGRPLFGATGA